MFRNRNIIEVKDFKHIKSKKVEYIITIYEYMKQINLYFS
jgi:hypothetical protein